jgi:hypothetical protein
LVDNTIGNTSVEGVTTRDYGLELVKEDDTWTNTHCFLEDITNRCFTTSDVLAEDIGTFDTEKFHHELIG